jgi:D-serine deaminase-like pyridoxal phosphate-dependent protein
MDTRERISRKAAAFWGGSALLIAGAGVTVAVQMSPASAAGSSTGTASTQNCGNCTGNNGKGAGNGSGTGAPAKQLTLSGSADSVVAPGVSGTLTVQVTNPNPQSIVLTALTATTTRIIEPRRNPALVACEASWISFSPFVPGPQPFVIGAGATRSVQLAINFDNKPFNQDNCKSVAYSYAFSAQGRQA